MIFPGDYGLIVQEAQYPNTWSTVRIVRLGTKCAHCQPSSPAPEMNIKIRGTMMQPLPMNESTLVALGMSLCACLLRSSLTPNAGLGPEKVATFLSMSSRLKAEADAALEAGLNEEQHQAIDSLRMLSEVAQSHVMVIESTPSNTQATEASQPLANTPAALPGAQGSSQPPHLVPAPARKPPRVSASAQSMMHSSSPTRAAAFEPPPPADKAEPEWKLRVMSALHDTCFLLHEAESAPDVRH